MAKNNFRKKKFFKKRKGKDLSARVSKIETQQRKMTEMKFHDVTASGTFGNANAVVISLGAIAQGLTDEGRIGNSINIKSVAFRSEIVGSNSASNSTYRVMLVKVKKDPIDVNEIIDALASNVLGYRNTDYTKDYKILYDNWGVVNNAPYWDSTASAVAFSGHRISKDYYKVVNTIATYDGTTTTDLAGNQYYAIFFSGDSAQLAYFFEGRIRYLDA